MSFPFPLPLILDGATGTNLIAAGLPSGVCVEQWILDHPQVITELQQQFIAAGVQAIYAPTFGANRHKLAGYGLQDQVEEMNLRLVELSKAVATPAGVLVGGDVSPAGILIEPYGEATFEELYDIYEEQIRALKKAGVDFISMETQMSLADMRAGVLAAKSVGLPVFVTMTVEENGRSVMGAKPLSVLLTLQAMGADAVGLNCSTGPDLMEQLLKELLPHACVPLIAKPNAGKPKEENSARYDLTPEQFSKDMERMLSSGIAIVGGCCGTTPEHMKALCDRIKEKSFVFPSREPDAFAAAIESEAFFIGDDIVLSPPIECSYDLSDDLIDIEDEQVNVALVEVNTLEDAKILVENAGMTRLPIDILVNDLSVLEYTLRNFQGRLLVDSKCGFEKDQLYEAAKPYGAIVY
ncbi:MAG: homocysteine S-methyltransferase family protein [Clostridiales bacterium]|jgi:methionine synthase I (cobalamin-dependent)|nr:homocysteine S-methyltransferase family protein [Clostridiales bacterium]